MEISEVRVKLMDDPGDRLKAFCSVTLDNSFVVRDLKIIEGSTGPFVAMPSRKLTSHCHKCSMKNHLRAAFCNQCGAKLDQNRAIKDEDGRAKLYADIAHPINSECREMIQANVIDEYHLEVDRSKKPDYISKYDEYYGETTEVVQERPTRVDHAHQRSNSHSPRGPMPGKSDSAPHTKTPSKVVEESNKDDFGAGIL